jgi:epoxyqueuosine reductase
MNMHNTPVMDWNLLATQIKHWGHELGFDAVGISSATANPQAEAGLLAWLAEGCHGSMDYMARHGLKRARPAELLPGTCAVISLRIDYWPQAADARAVLADATLGYISRYALGRDYHKLLRARLQQLVERIEAAIGPCIQRGYTDSAPLLEVDFAGRAGLGWRGKHTLLLTRTGSSFFLGEILTSLPLPADDSQPAHCGRCNACITACPTQAIVAPYRIDARRCISYLTIEHAGAIPTELRRPLGNRIYGCDDCQLACPWQAHAPLTREADFAVRHALDRTPLTALFAWSENEFKERLAGSPIYRIGHERWLRNIAVALGNALTACQGESRDEILRALQTRASDPSALVREHVAWALAQQPTSPAAL